MLQNGEFGGDTESSGYEYDSLDADVAFSMASEDEQDLGLEALEDLTLEDILTSFQSTKNEPKETKSTPKKNSTSNTKKTSNSSSSSHTTYSSKATKLPKPHLFHNLSPAAGVHALSDEENNQDNSIVGSVSAS